MARRKQREAEPEEEPQMNMSSMMDACFLLLIYFIVATSLVSEKPECFASRQCIQWWWYASSPGTRPNQGGSLRGCLLEW